MLRIPIKLPAGTRARWISITCSRCERACVEALLHVRVVNEHALELYYTFAMTTSMRWSSITCSRCERARFGSLLHVRDVNEHALKSKTCSFSLQKEAAGFYLHIYLGSLRIWNLTPRGPSTLNMPPLPSTTSTVNLVCFQYSYCWWCM